MKAKNKTKPLDEAKAFAAEQVRKMRTEPIDIFGVSVRLLAKDDSKMLASEMMKSLASSSDERLADLAHYAIQGWGLADDALQEIMFELVSAGKPIPKVLREYTLQMAEAPPRRIPGKGNADNYLRDVGIALIVMQVHEKFDITPTARGENPSCVRIVAEVLNEEASIPMGHKQVEGIWNRVGKMLLPS